MGNTELGQYYAEFQIIEIIVKDLILIASNGTHFEYFQLNIAVGMFMEWDLTRWLSFLRFSVSFKYLDRISFSFEDESTDSSIFSSISEIEYSAFLISSFSRFLMFSWLAISSRKLALLYFIFQQYIQIKIAFLQKIETQNQSSTMFCINLLQSNISIIVIIIFRLISIKEF